MTFTALLMALAVVTLAASVYVGLSKLAKAILSLGASVEGFWGGAPQGETAYVDLEQLMADTHLKEAEPGFGITDDMVLESELVAELS